MNVQFANIYVGSEMCKDKKNVQGNGRRTQESGGWQCSGVGVNRKKWWNDARANTANVMCICTLGNTGILYIDQFSKLRLAHDLNEIIGLESCRHRRCLPRSNVARYVSAVTKQCSTHAYTSIYVHQCS